MAITGKNKLASNLVEYYKWGKVRKMGKKELKAYRASQLEKNKIWRRTLSAKELTELYSTKTLSNIEKGKEYGIYNRRLTKKEELKLKKDGLTVITVAYKL